MSDTPIAPRKETDLPVPVSRTAGDLDHSNGIALSGFFTTLIKYAEPLSLSFEGDHGLMTDNDTDFKNSGQPIPKPEWRKGASSSGPVSYTINEPITVKLELSIDPPNADPIDCAIVGKGTRGLSQLSFSKFEQLRGGKATVTLKGNSLDPSPHPVGAFSGDIDWEISVPSLARSFKTRTTGHMVFITMGTPTQPSDSPTSVDRGFTVHRMKVAIARVQEAKSRDPQEIVKYLTTRVPGYTLRRIERLKELSHPDYYNGVGGAWTFDEFLESSAECQAIARWVLAILTHVGFRAVVPDIQLCFVWADPHARGAPLENVTSTLGLEKVTKQVGSEEWTARLLDHFPEVKKTYQQVSPAVADFNLPNVFEACLRMSFRGTLSYYALGAGANNHFRSAAEVLRVFFALCWVRFSDKSDPPPFEVKEVVRRWLDRAGKPIP
jgi:hypothetical protein